MFEPRYLGCYEKAFLHGSLKPPITKLVGVCFGERLPVEIGGNSI
jgi:hypothetical protein